MYSIALSTTNTLVHNWYSYIIYYQLKLPCMYKIQNSTHTCTSYLKCIYSSFWAPDDLPPRSLPVLLAAMRPTFLPGGVPLLTVLGLPICWWLPPPWGCSTGYWKMMDEVNTCKKVYTGQGCCYAVFEGYRTLLKKKSIRLEF